MAKAEYGPGEIEAVIESLRQIDTNDSPSYLIDLQLQVAGLFGKFFPAQIEKMLRSIGSNKYLVALSMKEIQEHTGPEVIAVLPQTGMKELPFGLTVAIAATQESFEKTLAKELKITFVENKRALPNAGFIVNKSPDPNYEAMRYFRPGTYLEVERTTTNTNLKTIGRIH